MDSPLASVIGVTLQELVSLTTDQVASVGLVEGSVKFGWLLLAPLFAVRAWRAAASGRGGEVSSLLVRAAVIGLLLTGMPTIERAAVRTWADAYAWASTAAGSLMNLDGDNMAEVREGIDGMAGDANVSAGLAAVLAFASSDSDAALEGIGVDTAVAGGMTGTAAAAGAIRAASAARVVFRWVARGVRAVLIPIMLFFLILLYISAITVILAVVVLPAVLPLLLTPIGGGLVAGVVTRAAAAFGAVIALPMIFAVAMNLGIILPVSRLVADVNTAIAELSATWGDMASTPIGFWQQFSLGPQLEAFGFVFSAMGRFLDVLMFGILGLIVGVFAAIAIVVGINQIFERLLGTIMVSGRAQLPRMPPPKGGGSTAATATAAGGGGGGGPSVRPDIGGSSGAGSTTPMNPSVTQPSAYAARQTQALNRPMSPEATPDAEV